MPPCGPPRLLGFAPWRAGKPSSRLHRTGLPHSKRKGKVSATSSSSKWEAPSQRHPASFRTSIWSATITFSEFRTLAWEVANEAARQLGWIRSFNELHEPVKRAASAQATLELDGTTVTDAVIARKITASAFRD